MNCAYFDRNGQCENTTEGTFPCCSSYHGFEFNKHLVMAKTYKQGLLKKEDLVEGDIIKRPWSEEEINHYLQRI